MHKGALRSKTAAKPLRPFPKVYGLVAQFTRLLLVSAAVSAAAFLALQAGGNDLMNHYFETSDFFERCTQQHIAELQSYVTDNDLALTDSEALASWYKGQRLLTSLQIYRGNVLRFDSFYKDQALLPESEAEDFLYMGGPLYRVTFADGDADVLLYSNDGYHFYVCFTLARLMACILLFLFLFLHGIRKIIVYISRLCTEVQVMEGGDLEHPITVTGSNELSTLAQSLESMRLAFRQQRQKEADFYSANQALITGMSHDLRTPLTKLMLYLEILKYGKYENEEQWHSYLARIEEKAYQIKQMSDNIFEYALLTKEDAPNAEAPAGMREIFADQLSEMAAYLQRSGFTPDCRLEWRPVYLSVCTPYIRRLLDNITSNLVQYADPAAPVQIRTVYGEHCVTLLFQNRIRADAANRHGTRIGLENVRTMMKKMQGSCQVEHTEKEFSVALRFPLLPQPQ